MLRSAIPLSGMQAASLRLTTAASNIANANANGSLPAASGAVPEGGQSTYQPVRVEQSSAADGTAVASVRNVVPSYVAAYDPDATYANEQGLVATPNVRIENEMLNLVMAKAEFSLNAVTADTINEMVKKLYDLGDS